ncbi:hypothetical protein BHE74_00026971, partial [Ensete ventricosum]
IYIPVTDVSTHRTGPNPSRTEPYHTPQKQSASNRGDVSFSGATTWGRREGVPVEAKRADVLLVQVVAAAQADAVGARQGNQGELLGPRHLHLC